MALRKCWAEPLGGCDDQISREHVVSANLWNGGVLDVSGFPWCRHEVKKVPVAKLTAKVLCRTHNSGLSDVDAAGGDLFEYIRRSGRLFKIRGEALVRKKWKVVEYEADGARLERWFLKTVINLGASRSAGGKWAIDRTPLAKPPEAFVRAAFGEASLEPPLGLYGVVSSREDFSFQERVEISTLLDNAGDVAAALIQFHGLRFFLNLQIGTVPRSFNLPLGGHWVPSNVVHHMGRINFNVAGRRSHQINFRWSTAAD